MGILIDNIKEDKKVFFDDFEDVDFVLADGTSFTAKALPSFIGIMEGTDGVEIGTDNAEIQIDYDAFLEEYPDKSIKEDDKITFLDQAGGDVTFNINVISRDRTLGIWTCQLHVIVDNDEAGIIDRSNAGAI